MLELMVIIYIIGLIGTENIFWPLRHIPQYRRWEEKKEVEHRLQIIEMKTREKELMKLEKQLDEELKVYLIDVNKK